MFAENLEQSAIRNRKFGLLAEVPTID